MKNDSINAQIINFERKTIKNDETGELKTMYSVNYAVETSPYKDHFGPSILNSYCSENAYSILNANIGKTVKIVLEDKALFGKNNMYKKVVSKINGVAIRQF